MGLIFLLKVDYKVIEHWSFNWLQVDIDLLKYSANLPNYKLSSIQYCMIKLSHLFKENS